MPWVPCWAAKARGIEYIEGRLAGNVRQLRAPPPCLARPDALSLLSSQVSFRSDSAQFVFCLDRSSRTIVLFTSPSRVPSRAPFECAQLPSSSRPPYTARDYPPWIRLPKAWCNSKEYRSRNRSTMSGMAVIMVNFRTSR